MSRSAVVAIWRIVTVLARMYLPLMTNGQLRHLKRLSDPSHSSLPAFVPLISILAL